EIVGKYTQIDEYIAIALLDLDKFKQINDTLGHQMGDKAIQTTATIIAEELNLDLLEKWSFANKVVKERISFAGRLGGDEYILFIRGLKNDEEAIALLNRILDRLKAVKIGELKGIRGSFGVTALKESDEDIDTAYQRADAALYTSKSSDTEKVTFNK
ncbi:MAG: GGDEF domain-containing protein, partial [Lachnospiraceae bacterium]|nr:GGDEF domain-containing protein [Lachnospiraceae bacterium]